MTDLEELKKLALAATPGEWKVCDESRENAVWHAGLTIYSKFGRVADVTPLSPYQSAAFIAAANPQTVLALMAENERLQRELEEARIQLSRKETTIGTVSSALTYAESQASEWRCKAGELDNENRRLKLDLEEARRDAASKAELYQLRSQNEVLLVVYDAAANLEKVKGRRHTEQAYQRLITALDATRQQKG